MAFDFNQAGPQREFGATIPDGTFVWVVGHLKDGGFTPPWAAPQDRGLFKQSKDMNSDTVMLDWEFTVQWGQHDKRKIFQMMTIAGGQLDDHGQSKGGNISKSMLRAMIESAKGILPTDESPQAVAARTVEYLRQLDGIPFGCRVEVEEGQDNPQGGVYPDKNRIPIGGVVTPEMPEYAMLRNKQEPPPRPNTGRKRTAAAGQQTNTGPQGGGGWAATPAQTAMPLSPPPAPPASPPPPPAAASGGWGNQQTAVVEQPAGAEQPASPPASGPGWLNG